MKSEQNLIRHNFYVFALDNRLFGLDIGYVHEVKDVVEPDEITPLPHSQYAVLGYVNVRGAVRQVISFRRLLGEDDAGAQEGGVIIYCKEAYAPETGIYCDHPGEILGVDEKDIDRWDGKRRNESEAVSDRAGYMACGASRTERGIITLLDPSRIYEMAGE